MKKIYESSGSFQIEEKFWNKDLYDNRVIFNPCRLTETFIEFTGYWFESYFYPAGQNRNYVRIKITVI